ncbi:MAG: hypothetical protein HOI66_23575 [Verrucomicrobia bacterium]|nr:hypothetical protein [Verrucomicrobiota bacterium]
MQTEVRTKREKGSTLSDVVQVCEEGIAIKIQTDVQAERCEGPEARGEMAIEAMQRTSGEGAVVQMLGNKIAIMTMTEIPTERCAVVEKAETKRQTIGRAAEVGVRLVASEVGKDDGKFAVIQIGVAIGLMSVVEGIRTVVEAKRFEAIVTEKAKGGAALFHGVGIEENNDVALPNEGGLKPVVLVKDLDPVAHSLLA